MLISTDNLKQEYVTYRSKYMSYMEIIQIICYKSPISGKPWECNVVEKNYSVRNYNDFYVSQWSMKRFAEKFSESLNMHHIKAKIFKKIFKD